MIFKLKQIGGADSFGLRPSRTPLNFLKPSSSNRRNHIAADPTEQSIECTNYLMHLKRSTCALGIGSYGRGPRRSPSHILYSQSDGPPLRSGTWRLGARILVGFSLGFGSLSRKSQCSVVKRFCGGGVERG